MRIQVTITGFMGQPVTLACLFDESTGVLVVAKQVSFTEKKLAPDFAMVSSAPYPETDFLFTDDHLSEAIRNYFTMKSQGGMTLDNSIARFNPENRIEQDTITETGRKYRISPDIDNGQIAVLAAIAYAELQKGIGDITGALDAMSEMYKIITI